MTTASLFCEFLKNIRIKNADVISENYRKVTKALNVYYYESDDETHHCRQIGSYGRKTGINGISDLDMAFELPISIYEKFNGHQTTPQSALLQDVKKVLQKVYPQKNVKADGQVVGIDIDGFRIEVLPTFFLDNDDDIYTFPDTNNGGSWRKTKPKKEIKETRDLNDSYKNNTYRYLCRMVRAWKNNVGANFSGLWIDTLCYNFLKNNEKFKEISFSSYDDLVKSYFEYLHDQYTKSPDQVLWKAPGSNQNVHGSWQNHRKIKKAYKLCLEALNDLDKANENWSRVFGIDFPEEEETILHESLLKRKKASTEQFVEVSTNGKIDIRNRLSIDYKISQESSTWKALRKRLGNYKTPISRDLEFFIKNTDVIPPYTVKWKVRNNGSEAIKRHQERGALLDSTSGKHMAAIRKERTSFEGEHWVECYIIKNGICVARDSVSVYI